MWYIIIGLILVASVSLVEQLTKQEKYLLTLIIALLAGLGELFSK